MSNSWTLSWHVMTPAEAADLLLCIDRRHQRPIDMKHVRTLANAMTSNMWATTSENIKIAYLGNKAFLIDGQHRLNAIIMANKSIQMLVARIIVANEAELMFYTTNIDIGRNRDTADRLHLLGIEEAKALTPSVKIMLNLVNGNPYNWRTKDPVTLTELHEFMKPCQLALREAAQVGSGLTKKLKGVPRRSWISAYFLTHQHHKNADIFWSAMRTGENLSEGNPMLTLREFILLNPIPDTDTHYIYDGVGVIFYAFNKFLEGKDLRRLRLPKRKTRDGKETPGYTWDRATKSGTFPWLKGMEP